MAPIRRFRYHGIKFPSSSDQKQPSLLLTAIDFFDYTFFIYTNFTIKGSFRFNMASRFNIQFIKTVG